MDFGALPPEINSGRMYTGPGPGPLLAAAQAWEGLAAELYAAATGYGSVVSELTGGPWTGPAAAAMTAAATPYVAWMNTTAAQAEQTAMQARAAVAAYEAAYAMTVPPPLIAANRIQLMTLVATNFFGQNTPAIAATEIQYAEMWAQDAAAMYGYAGASSTASTVTPFTRPADTTNQAGLAGQAAAVAKAAGTQAGTSAQTAASTSSQLVSASTSSHVVSASTSSHVVSASTVSHALQQLSSSSATATSPSQAAPSTTFLTTSNWDALRRLLGQTYFFNGMPQFVNSIAQQLIPGTAGGAGSAGSAPLPGAGLPAWGGLGGGGPVTASAGNAGTLGRLSVPPSWAAGTPGLNEAAAMRPFSNLAAGSQADSHGLLRGMPLSGAGRRVGGGFTHRYGFRYPVMTRPPSAG